MVGRRPSSRNELVRCQCSRLHSWLLCPSGIAFGRPSERPGGHDRTASNRAVRTRNEISIRYRASVQLGLQIRKLGRACWFFFIGNFVDRGHSAVDALALSGSRLFGSATAGTVYGDIFRGGRVDLTSFPCYCRKLVRACFTFKPMNDCIAENDAGCQQQNLTCLTPRYFNRQPACDSRRRDPSAPQSVEKAHAMCR